jgi:hypothetical protein
MMIEYVNLVIWMSIDPGCLRRDQMHEKLHSC